MALPEIADPAALAARVSAAAEADDVLRIKGFAAVPGKPMRLLVQAVGPRVAHHYDRPWSAGEPRAGRLVVIGLKGIDRAAITRALDGLDACICWRPAPRRSTRSSSRSISASRRATSRCCRFADSDLAGLAAAWATERDALPSVRLAQLRDLKHPMSVDLWIERVGAHAKVIVVRLLGGLDWWRYGVERLAALARERGIALALLPGEDRDDPRLAEASTLPPDELATLLRYFREGGRDNLAALLRRLARHAGAVCEAPAPRPVPRLAGYLPDVGAVDLDRLATALAAGPARGPDRLLSLDAARGRHGADRRAVRGARRRAGSRPRR